MSDVLKRQRGCCVFMQCVRKNGEFKPLLLRTIPAEITYGCDRWLLLEHTSLEKEVCHHAGREKILAPKLILTKIKREQQKITTQTTIKTLDHLTDKYV